MEYNINTTWNILTLDLFKNYILNVYIKIIKLFPLEEQYGKP